MLAVFFAELSMAIDSPLLRQKEQENLLIAAKLKQKRLKIKVGFPRFCGQLLRKPAH
ncbi:hypothetical protein [Cyanobium sp. L1E-Cus]|uniref:hypothetical protein n=1 Tax=Cyanobium sp. L1E-Cus TaxID=2823714 RepID=UPI0020CC4612|nr:hypothetical protein [Cyanobium sp. L1E-Cus]MCP9823739.1 hypothetical protein [Cyanobium sp. L1E-Cus]